MCEDCKKIDGNQYLAPGWGCCQCRTYNGAWRTVCKFCGHRYELLPTQPPATMRN